MITSISKVINGEAAQAKKADEVAATWVTATYIVATLESSLHVLIHVVMIKSHEEGVDDDTQCDE
jgi:hypothetical protein